MESSPAGVGDTAEVLERVVGETERHSSEHTLTEE